jgi:hypothetical protein
VPDDRSRRADLAVVSHLHADHLHYRASADGSGTEREVAMLNQQDRRRLAAIERQILIDGPAFARRLGRGSVVVTSTWWKVAAAIIGILCGLATLIGTLSNSGTLTASSAALAAAWWAFYRAGHTRRRRS